MGWLSTGNDIADILLGIIVIVSIVSIGFVSPYPFNVIDSFITFVMLLIIIYTGLGG